MGRARELALLTSLLDGTEAGHGTTLLLAGEGGIGKSRLALATMEQAERRGITVAVGRAYPVETGVPYAPFSDAFLPLLRRIDAAQLQLLTRGGSAELVQLFPALATGDRAGAVPRGDPSDVKARLFWNFAQFLARLSARQPLLVVLENLQWADASSLELLHFLARQVAAERIGLLCTYNETERDLNPTLRTTEQSLVQLGAARSHRVEPLTLADTGELVQRIFHSDPQVTRDFVPLLYGWTRGNPFFVEETLKALVEAGRLHERDGTWLGWEAGDFELPRTIREALVARLDRLSTDARAIANLAAVIGTRASFETLASVSGVSRPALLGALDELRRGRVLIESEEGDAVVYDFGHPMLQQTLYAELGLARARLLHATVAEALEQLHGPRAAEHADELALHFARADARQLAPKAVKYLLAAGRNALARSANREAADYLSAALELLRREPAADGESAEGVAEELARARQRLGEYDAAVQLLEQVRDSALAAGRHAQVAAVERRLGLARYWSGRHEDALSHYEAGIAAAREAGEEGMVARIHLARGMCLQELGRHAEAREEVQHALGIAERLGNQGLLARTNRALMLLHVWTGPAELARDYGRRAIELAESSGQRSVAWSAHWALAMLAGLTGNAAEVARHVAESERLADELRSPVLRVWTAEVSIEYASGIGDWDAGIALAERTIALARGLGQRTLLPRLLVWTGLMYMGRGDLERGKRYVDEAWQLAGADRPRRGMLDVHTVVPAHTGLAAYHLAVRDYAQAIRVGEAGLAIADRTGYVVWAIHRLLPVVAEAALWAADLDRAERIGARLRRDSAKLGHELGLAWADACDALVALLRGDAARAVGLLRGACEELEAIPFTADAARLRRQLARALAETGDREGAMRELRRAHDVFARLGAEQELRETRVQLRQLGVRPPVRPSAPGAAGLTGREVEIVRLVAARKANKEIAQALGISPRTVSTHLSNIFAKVGVGSRGELADFARSAELVAR